ncbi:hypothetical protein MA6G0728R_5014 [Mycobacteroides abscessus 6G-0728-R]|uniref:Uncharacterized protein n=1 Tax=Mycobacteroides abscessus 1948 TaxID=1299323 RepID=A0A829QLK9_9MYCO|nr:hypothetical protein MA6G0125S_5084 [Mycobacteroides abscessus 6G-0125-S]EIU40281.1 hypothetical protein MA6G0125R_4043 [Mycobacteroides abscessus 6G-0125-R]EIU52541.1 hypothetical protein MA6G1108_5013 [Mycobacteroides abscessus 6G-1108]EIU54546.1 hypothetical protein MA6G0728S_4775 [Mycobacteroides abscessus 6G-0728-S]EIU90106.1 hypothetical protein MA6G0212_5070 [Mycobacteroides abscessus 6G-0212]EIU96198.1 hypothetical protein MA6G0728R_5014 [Mycobacteroides abscessus 6G-0728-R]EIV2147
MTPVRRADQVVTAGTAAVSPLFTGPLRGVLGACLPSPSHD